MKTLLLSLMLLLGGSYTTEVADTYVYVCTGPYAKRYHKTKTCGGLRNCSETIVKVTLKEAVADGKTQCQRCYK